MHARTVLLLVAASFLAGCGDLERQVDVALQTRVLHFGNGAEPQALDPQIVTGVPESHLMLALCEGLTAANPRGGPVEPGVAERWEVSADGLTYTFYLNPRARWSNGDPVTAEDVRWSWQRLLSPGLGSQYPEMLYHLRGAEAFNRGTTDDFSKVGVEVLGPRVLRVRLERPTPYFLWVLNHYSTWPVHPATVLAHGEMDDRSNPWARPGSFVCNGPFQLKSWSINEKLVVERNPHYWDADRVWLNEIHFYPVDHESSEFRMFQSGSLHNTNNVPTAKIRPLQNADNKDLHIEPYYGTYFYRLNTTKPPFNDVRVRRALAYSIDRKAIVERITQGGQLPAFSFTPPDPAGYVPDTQVPHDPELARQLLAEAGYPGGEGFPDIELLYNTQESHQRIAQAIQQMWRRELGINIRLSNQDWKVYLARQRMLDFDISRAGWIGDYPDPMTFLDIMVTGRGNNETGWGNPEYDQLLLTAAQQQGDERYATLRRAERLLVEAMPILPIYTYTRVYMLSPDVKGWYPNVLDTHPPKYIRLQRD